MTTKFRSTLVARSKFVASVALEKKTHTYLHVIFLSLQ